MNDASRPLILLANDDGVQAPGLAALAACLTDLGQVVVAAPDRERSAASHALSLHRPLRATELRPGWFSIDGTPADCVYLALYHLLPRLPELAISGINLGYNLGSDVFYSGTVAAAAEAAIRGVPAIAVSLEWSGQPDFAPVAALAHALARGVLERGLPSRTLINLNAPTRPGPLRYAWTGLGQRVYREQVEARTDLRGQHYYWIGGPPQGFGDVAGSDCHSVRDGIASLTPLDLDLTHHGLLEQLPNWRLEGAEQVEG